jgi:hypothetical protein
MNGLRNYEEYHALSCLCTVLIITSGNVWKLALFTCLQTVGQLFLLFDNSRKSLATRFVQYRTNKTQIAVGQDL